MRDEDERGEGGLKRKGLLPPRIRFRQDPVLGLTSRCTYSSYLAVSRTQHTLLPLLLLRAYARKQRTPKIDFEGDEMRRCTSRCNAYASANSPTSFRGGRRVFRSPCTRNLRASAQQHTNLRASTTHVAFTHAYTSHSPKHTRPLARTLANAVCVCVCVCVCVYPDLCNMCVYLCAGCTCVRVCVCVCFLTNVTRVYECNLSMLPLLSSVYVTSSFFQVAPVCLHLCVCVCVLPHECNMCMLPLLSSRLHLCVCVFPHQCKTCLYLSFHPGCNCVCVSVCAPSPM